MGDGGGGGGASGMGGGSLGPGEGGGGEGGGGGDAGSRMNVFVSVGTSSHEAQTLVTTVSLVDVGSSGVGPEPLVGWALVQLPYEATSSLGAYSRSPSDEIGVQIEPTTTTTAISSSVPR